MSELDIESFEVDEDSRGGKSWVVQEGGIEGSGRPRKKKRRARLPKKTQKKFAELTTTLKEQRKIKEAENILLMHIKHNFNHSQPEKSDEEENGRIETYIKWVAESLKQNYPSLEEDGLKKTVSEVKVNVGTEDEEMLEIRPGVRIEHVPSGIYAFSKEEVDPMFNENAARAGLSDNLARHIKSWRTYIGKNEIGEDIVRNAVQSFLEKNQSETNLQV